MKVAVRGGKGYHSRLAVLLVGVGAIVQNVAAADIPTYRIRANLPPCLEFPNLVSVSDEGQLNHVLRQVEDTYSEYNSLGHSCEVQVSIAPSATPYRMHRPVSVSGVSLRLVKGTDASGTTTGEVRITAPPGHRAFLVRGNMTQLIATGITFEGGDLSSSAAIWAGKKSYDSYLVSSGLGQTAYATSGENPLYEGSGGTASPLYDSRYAGSQLGATKFDVISAADTPMFDKKKQTTKPVLANTDQDCDGTAERRVGATKWGNIRIQSSSRRVGAPNWGNVQLMKPGTVKFKTAGFSSPSSCSVRERRWAGTGRNEPSACRSRGIIINSGTGGVPPRAASCSVDDGGDCDDADPRRSVTGAAFIAAEAAEARARKTAAVEFVYRESAGLTRGPLANGVNLEDLTLADASAAAGGLFSIRNASVLFTDCTFTDSVALLGGALHLTRASTARLDGCKFSRCKAFEDGGAVFLDSSSLVSVHRSVFSDGVADNGGALFAAEGSRIVATSSWFMRNTGRRCGGALALDDEASMLYCESCAITGNRAENGGGVCVGRSSLSDFGFSRFADNSALHSGGAFFTEPSSIMRVSLSVFEGSSAFFGKDGYVYGSLPYFEVYWDPKSPPQVESSSITAPAKQTQGVDFGTIAEQVPAKDPPTR